MTNLKRIALGGALIFVLAACGENGSAVLSGGAGAEGELPLETDEQRRSYALGMDVGNSLKNIPTDVDSAYVAQGMKETLEDNARLEQKEMEEIMTAFVKDIETAQREKQDALAQENQEKSEQFLAENKSKEGVKTTDSGLQYKVVEAGQGESPAADDRVKVHYTGTLMDGTEFDSSHTRGQPATFPLNAVIPGWTEGLQLMKEGAKYKFFVPPELAYGTRGAGAKIGPNQALIFDVELLEVLDEEAKAAGETAEKQG